MLQGKHILITGVTSDKSIAFSVAKIAQEQGATVVLSNLGRALGFTKRVAYLLPTAPPVIELDVTDAHQLAQLPVELQNHIPHLDGIVHSIAFANPKRALGGAFLETSWEDVAVSLHTSAYSYKSLTMACKPMLTKGASVVGLTFGDGLAWPSYDWMGVAKATLESTNKYLAKYLGPDGIRTNLVTAGPIDTIAKMAIPGSENLNQAWDQRAPLGWNAQDAKPTAQAVVALLSDWFPATTGATIPVDGGVHSVGA